MNSTYHKIYSNAQERKLLKIKVDQAITDKDEKDRVFKKNFAAMEKENIDFIRNEVSTLAKMLQIQNVDKIHEKTGSPLKTFKILLSLYRRVRNLAKMEKDGKTKL